MALVEKIATTGYRIVRTGMSGSAVPLARRNFVANGRRLVRSLAGIAFAALLMMVELGLQSGFVESSLAILRRLDGELMLMSSAKYQFVNPEPFNRRQLYAARGVSGVASVRPLYIQRGTWKNPKDLKLTLVMVFAFDPDQPVFLFPEINAHLDALRQPDTIMVDRRAREAVGSVSEGTETELSRRKVTVVGTFQLGPDFFSDGNVIMSDRNFFKFFGAGSADPAELPDVEIGVVKVLPGYAVSDVQRAIAATMPENVELLTKSELIAREAQFHDELTAVGPMFWIGTVVGFAVGMLISYQILFSELSDQTSQYATLKAMGYENRYLVKVVLQQAVFYALLGYIPAWLLSHVVFHMISEMALMPMSVSFSLTAISLGLTVVMCVASAIIAVRRVIAADPAELFR
jgi:putative ABC transport system permease protein